MTGFINTPEPAPAPELLAIARHILTELLADDIEFSDVYESDAVEDLTEEETEQVWGLMNKATITFALPGESAGNYPDTSDVRDAWLAYMSGDGSVRADPAGDTADFNLWLAAERSSGQPIAAEHLGYVITGLANDDRMVLGDRNDVAFQRLTPRANTSPAPQAGPRGPQSTSQR